jgi:hypothetical protein
MQTHKQIHLESLNLTLNSQPSKGDEWERVCSAQEDVKMIKMSREVPKSRPPAIYRGPQRLEPLGSSLCLPQGDRTHDLQPLIAQMSPRVIVFNLVCSISTVGNSQHSSQQSTGRSAPFHLTQNIVESGHFQ